MGSSITTLCARHLLGRSVKDRHGTSLGAIEDLVLDKHTNHVVCAVLVFEGLLGGDKYHSLPFTMLHYDPVDGSYVADVCKELLQATPVHSVRELMCEGGMRLQTYSAMVLES